MFTAGAPDGDGHVSLALAAVSVNDNIQQPMVGVEKLDGTGLAQHVVADLGVLPGVWSQVVDPMRVR